MAARRNVLVVGHDHDNDDDESPQSLSSTPCVLILGGWSTGPLLYLTRYLRQQQQQQQQHHSTTKSIQLLQPSLIMPPMGISWCTNIPFVLLMTLTVGFGWYAYTTCQRIYQQNGASASVQYYQSILLFTIMGLVWMRALVGHVVKHAIKHNMRICQRLLAEHNIVMVIGFSWGAAMGAELIAQGLLEQSSSSSSSESSSSSGMSSSSSKLPMIPSLLIAPTTSLIAQCSLPPFRTDAAYRVQRKVLRTRRNSTNQTTNESSNLPPSLQSNNKQNNHLPMVHVVHAYGDDCFCPHPERWKEEQQQETNIGFDDDDNGDDAHEDPPEIQLTMLEDNHIFLHPHSQRQLIQIVDGMMRRAVAL